jgi:phosphoglycolate phosphatase
VSAGGVPDARLAAVEVVYTDLDNTLLGPGGSLLTSADRRPTARAAQALVAAAEAGVTVVPVSGRALPQLRNDIRLLGLADCIAEVGAIVVRDGRTHYEWGACPRDLAASPHDALVVAGAVGALLDAFAGDLRHYEPWHLGREGGHLFHGVVDVTAADAVLGQAGCGWATLLDNGATEGWPGRQVRAYHLVPRGVGKAVAVADDLAARGLRRDQAVAIGDSAEDLTMAPVVGAFFMVANGDANGQVDVIRTPGAMGNGFADAVSAILAARLLPDTT